MKPSKLICTLSVPVMLAASAYSDNNIVKPIADNGVEFGEGKLGKAAVFHGGDRMCYSSQFIKANAGTVELWICPEKIGDLSFLFSVGINSPTWFIATLDRQNLSFTISKKGAAAPEAYARLSANSDILKPNEWHQLAFTWGYTKSGECLVQLYIDGKLRDAAYNSTILKDWDGRDSAIGIACNTANSKSKDGFIGMMDELRISNYPKPPSELESAYKLVLEGKSLPAEDQTLLLLHFDGDADGISATQAALPLDKVEKYVQQSIEEEDSK